MRIIQKFWGKKTIDEIAWLLDRDRLEVARKIGELRERFQEKVKLHGRPVLTKVLTAAKEKDWAKKQLKEPAPMKIADDSDKISVRIDAKTIIRVKPGTDIDAVIARYKKALTIEKRLGGE